MIKENITKQTRNKRTEIELLLQEIGFPVNLDGFPYLTHALLLIDSDETLLKSVTKRLYPLVAEYFHTTPICVERSMRHAISIAWLRGNLELQQQLFRHSTDPKKGKPTNSEFLCLISRKIRDESNELIL